MRSFATILTTISLPLYALAAHHGNRDHSGLALRARGDVLQRDFSARMTYYDITVGPVACAGAHYGANDFVCALNHPQFGDGAGTSQYCGKTITITYNGKSVSAVIVDECMGCPYGGIDLTEGLFRALAGSLDAGVVYGSWSFGDGGPPPEKHTTTTPEYTPPKTTATPHHDPPSPTPTPKTTSTPPPPSSSSTSTSKTSSSVWTTSVSSTSQSYAPSSSATSASSSVAPYGSPGGAADPSGTVDDGQTNAIADIYNCISDLGQIVVS